MQRSPAPIVFEDSELTHPDLTEMGLVEAAALIAAQKLSPVEITEACLERISALDGKVNAVLRLLPERAMAAAKQAETEAAAGKLRGPLHGVPYALKDIIDLEGVPTTGHSQVLADAPPAAANATVAARLEQAGGICLAKLSTWEFAVGGPSFDLPWPPARNPWDLERTPGGSSSGSGAGVAARFFPAALGTDTGGSIRNPAAACGIVGLKPTYGRVPLRGVLPLSTSLDHVGPMTRTVRDNAAVFQVIAGHDPNDPTTATLATPNAAAGLDKGVRGMKIGVIRHFWERDGIAEPEIASATEAALEVYRSLGAELVDIELEPLREYVDILKPIMAGEAYAWHRRYMTTNAYGALARDRINAGATQTTADYLDAMEKRSQMEAAYRQSMQGVEAALTIVTLAPPPRFDDAEAMARSYSLEGRPPFNIVRAPALAMPMGATATGLPLAIQVVGRHFDEATVYRVAAAYEDVTEWAKRCPPL